MKSHSKEEVVKIIWKNYFSTWKGPSEKSSSLIPLLFSPLSDIINSTCTLLLSKLLVVIRVIPKSGIFSKILKIYCLKKINGKVFLFFTMGKLAPVYLASEALGNKLCSLTKSSRIKLWLLTKKLM